MRQSKCRRLLEVGALCFAAVSAGSFSVEPPSVFPDPIAAIGPEPWGMIAYDLNADGILDVVSANGFYSAGGSLSVLMGRGDGTFSEERRYPRGNRLFGLDAGDLNGDGHADIAVSAFYEGRVFLLMGGADGEFVSGTDVTCLTDCASVLIRDFNGDGRNDLAVSDVEKISVRLGNSDGTLSVPVNTYTYYPANAMSAGDLDGDGVLDLVITDVARILHGRGDGTFDIAEDLGLCTDVDLGDLNNDGWLDVVMAESRGQLSVRLNVAGSGFSDPLILVVDHDYPWPWVSSAVADINGDGILDIALGGQGSLSVFTGVGDGTFHEPPFTSNSGSSYAMASGDFNRDGREDVAVPEYPTMDRLPEMDLYVHFGQPDGSLGLGSILVKTPLPAFGFALGDLDEDGDEDMVAALRGSYPTSLGGLGVYLGDGHGAFATMSGPLVESNPFDLELGDLNGDGHRDVVVVSSGIRFCIPAFPTPICYWLVPPDIRSYLGYGDGSFELRSAFEAAGSGSLVLDDFDRDGELDLAHSVQGGIQIRLGLGDGTFGPQSHYGVWLHLIRLDAADVNGDGRPDLVAGGGRVTLPYSLYLLINREGGFEPPVGLVETSAVSDFVLQDLDGDGSQDIATIDYGELPYQDHRFMLLYGHGDGSFDSVVIPSGDYQTAISAGDFDGDGHVDLATQYGGLNIYRGGGVLPYSSPLRFRSDGSRDWAVAIDIDRNGRLDIVTSSDQGIRIHLNQLPPPNSPPVAVASAPAVLECASPAGAAVTLDASASSDVDSTTGTADDIVLYEWFEQTPSGEVPLGTGVVVTLMLPLGAHTVGLRVTDAAGASSTAEMGVEVVDTTPPPLTVSSSLTTLWPPDHRLVDVRLMLSATDLCGPAAASIISVTSSEPEDGPGWADGVTRPDVVVGSGSVWLRAERDARGPGRVYTIQASAVDAAGLTAAGRLDVRVPHDRRSTTAAGGRRMRR